MKNKYEELVQTKKYYRSCIMIEELKYLEDFKKLGIIEIRKNNNGVLICNIPLNNIEEFVKLYLKVMNPGRWNEYVGPTTGFYFKMINGETKHIELTDTTELEINKTIQKFIPNWDINQNIWEWLKSIDIYEDWLNI